MRHRPWPTVALLVCSSAPTAFAGLAADLICSTNMQIPGQPAGVQFGTLNPPSVSANGNICVVARPYWLENSLDSLAVVFLASGSVSSIRENSPLTSLPESEWHAGQHSATPIVRDDGTLYWPAIFGAVATSIASDGCFVTNDDNQLLPYFKDGSPIVGMAPGWTLRIKNRFALQARFGHGVGVAQAYLESPDASESRNALVLNSVTGVHVVAQATDPAPGLPDGEIIGEVLTHAVNASGCIVFGTSNGVWVHDAQKLTPIWLKDQVLATRYGPVTLQPGFRGVGINDKGQCVADATTLELGRVVLAGDANGLSIVARIHPPRTATDDDEWIYPDGPVINAAGNVAVVIDNPLKDKPGTPALCLVRPDTVTPVAANGDPAPGFPSDWKLQDVGWSRFEVNASDSIVFGTRVQREGSTDDFAWALFAWTPGTGLSLVAAADQPLQLVNGHTIPVIAVSHVGDLSHWDAPAGGQDGGNRILADNGQVVFMVMGPSSVFHILATTLPGIGDINADSLITGADLSVLLAQFGHSVKPGESGDFNLDGLVNASDLSVLLSALANRN